MAKLGSVVFFCGLLNFCESNDQSTSGTKSLNEQGLLNRIAFPKWNRNFGFKNGFREPIQSESRFWPPPQKENRCKFFPLKCQTYIVLLYNTYKIYNWLCD